MGEKAHEQNRCGVWCSGLGSAPDWLHSVQHADEGRQVCAEPCELGYLDVLRCSQCVFVREDERKLVFSLTVLHRLRCVCVDVLARAFRREVFQGERVGQDCFSVRRMRDRLVVVGAECNCGELPASDGLFHFVHGHCTHGARQSYPRNASFMDHLDRCVWVHSGKRRSSAPLGFGDDPAGSGGCARVGGGSFATFAARGVSESFILRVSAATSNGGAAGFFMFAFLLYYSEQPLPCGSGEPQKGRACARDRAPCVLREHFV